MNLDELDRQEEEFHRDVERRAGAPAELVAAEHATDQLIPNMTGEERREYFNRARNDLRMARRDIEQRWPAEQWPGLRERLAKAEAALQALETKQ